MEAPTLPSATQLFHDTLTCLCQGSPVSYSSNMGWHMACSIHRFMHCYSGESVCAVHKASMHASSHKRSSTLSQCDCQYHQTMTDHLKLESPGSATVLARGDVLGCGGVLATRPQGLSTFIKAVAQALPWGLCNHCCKVSKLPAAKGLIHRLRESPTLHDSTCVVISAA